MSTQGLLSIITATYNNSDLLPRFFDSILAQEYSNWELIIVNDGSTDNTAEVCHTYAKKDARIRYYEQNNQGQGVARNFALKLIRGEYVVFLDADDAIKTKTYSAAIKLLEAHPECDIVAYPMEWINKIERFITFRAEEPRSGYTNILEDLLVYEKAPLMITDKLYRTQLVQHLTFIPNIVFDDNLMMVQIALQAKGMCFSTEGGYEYHQAEYDPDKNSWTSHKEYSQVFVNCKYIDVLAGDSSLRDCRAKVYLKLANQLSYYIKTKGTNQENAQRLKKYIKEMPISDTLCNSVLSIKHKVKLFLLKAYCLS